MYLGKLLKELRTKNNLSQQDLAKKLFIDAKTVSAYENDRIMPPLYMIQRIAQIFDTHFTITDNGISIDRSENEMDKDNTKTYIKELDITVNEHGNIVDLDEDTLVKMYYTTIDKLPDNVEISIPIDSKSLEEQLNISSFSVTKTSFEGYSITSVKTNGFISLEKDCRFRYVDPASLEPVINDFIESNAYAHIYESNDSCIKFTAGYTMNLVNVTIDDEEYEASESEVNINGLSNEIRGMLYDIYNKASSFANKNVAKGKALFELINDAVAGKSLTSKQVMFLEYMFGDSIILEHGNPDEHGEMWYVTRTLKKYWPVANEVTKLNPFFIEDHKNELIECVEKEDYITLLNILKLTVRDN